VSYSRYLVTELRDGRILGQNCSRQPHNAWRGTDYPGEASPQPNPHKYRRIVNSACDISHAQVHGSHLPAITLRFDFACHTFALLARSKPIQEDEVRRLVFIVVHYALEELAKVLDSRLAEYSFTTLASSDSIESGANVLARRGGA